MTDDEVLEALEALDIPETLRAELVVRVKAFKRAQRLTLLKPKAEKPFRQWAKQRQIETFE